MEHFDTLIVGAGSAGSYLAKSLKDNGQTVVIIEKSRGSGGRCARRQTPTQQSVDIGCISLSPSQTSVAHGNKNIADLFSMLIEQGVLKDWQVNYADIQESHLVGTPNMNSMHKVLLDGIDVRTQHRVINLTRGEHDNWIIECGNEAIFSATQVVVTSPPAQANAMTTAWPKEWLSIFDKADRSIEPQWSCIVEIAPECDLQINALRDHAIIMHAVSDSSKPDRKHNANLWVVQATPDWTSKHLNLEPAHAGDLLCDALCAALNINPDKAKCISSHRWLFGRSTNHTVADGCLWDSKNNIGLAADWLNGGGLHAALISADNLLQRMTE